MQRRPKHKKARTDGESTSDASTPVTESSQNAQADTDMVNASDAS